MLMEGQNKLEIEAHYYVYCKNPQSEYTIEWDDINPKDQYSFELLLKCFDALEKRFHSLCDRVKARSLMN